MHLMMSSITVASAARSVQYRTVLPQESATVMRKDALVVGMGLREQHATSGKNEAEIEE